MKKFNLALTLGLAGSFFFASCDKDDDNDVTPPTNSTGDLVLDISGLENLGDNYAYEGWIMVNGSPMSAGIFMVNDNGELSKTSFEIESEYLDAATAYILTIEPYPDNDPAPSDVHILAGDFSGNSADIAVDHAAAIGTDFESSMGKYILATPTDGGSMTNELSGVWWLDPMAGPAAGLTLPTLPSGWEYEGWAVIDGTPVSTGKFTAADMPDDFSGYSATDASAPPFPGEDFLMNAPNGLTFPTDLSGGLVVISVEPMPDNSAAPFVLKPLVGMVPDMPMDHSAYSMENNAMATNPTGMVMR